MGKSKTRKKRPYWQDAPCPSWCWGKHEDCDGVPDRNHFSKWEGREVLTQYSAAHGWYPDYPGGPDHEYTEPVVLLVNLEQAAREASPRVYLCTEGTTGKDRPADLNLTVAEAAKLSKMLAKAVKIAESAVSVEATS